MFAAFAVMRTLHELLWYLNEALALPQADQFRDDLQDLLAATERLTLCGPDELAAVDVAAHRGTANSVLLRVSDHVRERAGHAWS